MARKVVSKQDAFLNEIALKQHPYINKFYAVAEQENAQIQLSSHEVSIVSFLIKQLLPKRILEIGTLNGFSAYCMHVAADCVVDTIELNQDAAQRSKRNLAMLNADVNVLLGDAEQIIPTLYDGSYDIVFIDANKAAYPSYLAQAERLLRVGGVLIADNVFLFGNVYDEAWQETNDKSLLAMKKFISELSQHERFDATIIPTTEGMMIARKKY